MSKEIIFKKYHTQGADYHYKQIDRRSLFNFNAHVSALYQIELEIV